MFSLNPEYKRKISPKVVTEPSLFPLELSIYWKALRRQPIFDQIQIRTLEKIVLDLHFTI